jgi:hypothetical protein
MSAGAAFPERRVSPQPSNLTWERAQRGAISPLRIFLGEHQWLHVVTREEQANEFEHPGY